MLKVVENRRDNFIDLMKEMISIRSYTCEEKEFAEMLMNRLSGLPGVDEAFIDGAGNMCAIIRGEGNGPAVMLNGHMDAVFEGNLENWAPYNPYVPEIVDGKLIGRGISDLKGGLAAHVCAFEDIAAYVAKTGKKLPGDLIFLGVVQEEPAEMFGMEYFFDVTMKEKDIKCDLVYLCEPSSLDLAIAQRGKVELVVRTYGKCAHSSAPEEGINALEHMIPVLQRIFAHEGIDLQNDAIGRTPITVTNCIVKPGGTLSCIPDECEISIDRRYAPAQKLEDLVKEFEVMFEEIKKNIPDFKATVEPRVYEETSWTGYTNAVKKYHPAWATPADHEFVKATIKALEAVGQTPKTKQWKFGTDGGTTCAIHGIPTIGYSGAMESQAHQPKEYVDVEDMVKTYEGYVSILAELYGIAADEI